MFFVINRQDTPDAQSIFRYTEELDSIVGYYNALASNYSAYKQGAIKSFAVSRTDENFNEIEKAIVY